MKSSDLLHFCRIYIALLATGFLAFTGCYDDSALLGRLEDHEDRLNRLETLCEQQNTNINSLKDIVDALQEKDYVTDIKEIKKDGKTVGYTINFSKSGPVTIYNGQDGGHVPLLGVKQDEDGEWYWTVDGEWMLNEGEKVKASGKDGQDGITPKLKIVDGLWYVSYDGGRNWEPEPLGPATGTPGQGGGSIFSGIDYDNEYVYLTLADGTTKLVLPRKAEIPVTVTLDDVTESTAVFSGYVNAPESELDYISVIVRYSTPDRFSAVDESLPYVKARKPDFGADGSFTLAIDGLEKDTEYKYCIIIRNRSNVQYGEVKSFRTMADKPEWADRRAWVHGLQGIPEPGTWKIVDNLGSTQYGLKWDASYGWFDCNKADPNGETDSKMCWAAAASNMIHWWLHFNADNIVRYGKYSGPSGYRSSTDEGVFTFFKNNFFNTGNPVHYGLDWFFTGLNQFAGGIQSPKTDEAAGFFKEVLGENISISEYYQFPSSDQFNEKIKDALGNRKCISIVHDYVGIPHAINIWGADFDADGNVSVIYVTDNNDINYEHNREPLTPAGLLKRKVEARNGRIYMQNWQGNCTIEIQAISLMGLMSDKWEAYFAKSISR